MDPLELIKAHPGLQVTKRVIKYSGGPQLVLTSGEATIISRTLVESGGLAALAALSTIDDEVGSAIESIIRRLNDCEVHVKERINAGDFQKEEL
jgi:hypothetical protein